VTYREARTLMQDLKQLGAHNITAGRPRGLTGRRRLQRMLQAYEDYRRDGVLPASYEVVYGHAWAPPDTPAAGGIEVRLGVPRDAPLSGRHD
jgi:malonyl-CoA O-methyltransferase